MSGIGGVVLLMATQEDHWTVGPWNNKMLARLLT
jgi:hypothetical protein